jgi:hypothetical protein
LTLALREQGASGQQLSPAGLAYQRAWDRVQRLQAQLADMDTAAQAHQAAMAQLVPPWRAAYRAHLQAVVQALGAALAHGGPGLSPTQRRTAQAALQAHADALASLAQPRVRSEPEPEPDAGPEHAAPGAAPDPQAAKRAARQAKREQRAARQRATPAGQADALAQQGADTTLRALYRQLASALHPDREPEGPARDRKNALMGEANAAYQRQDMAALLRLQHTLLAEASTPPDTTQAAGTDQRLAALARLLQQQASDLDRQRQAAQQRWWAVLVLPQGTPLTAAHLASVWARAQAEKVANEAAMAAELAQLQRPNTLKGWLNKQSNP